MEKIRNSGSCFISLFIASAKAHHSEFRRTAVMSIFMLAQNMVFFTLWVVFFGSIKQIKGWQLPDVAIMMGVLATSVGLALFLADGARSITTRVLDGSIDAFITRPRHPLPALLFSGSEDASMGDIITGPILWFTIGGATLSQLPLLLALSFLSAIIFLSATVMIYSLAFWINRSSRFSYQLFETLLIFSNVPQHSQSIGIKVVMFSVLPAGFISLLPVTIMQHFDITLLAVIAAAAVFYACLAVWVFNAGVRRYVTG